MTMSGVTRTRRSIWMGCINMRELSPSVYPDGGFYYVDAEKMVFESSSLDELVAAVTDYRRQMGRPPGEPRREVTEQICRRSPAACRESPAQPSRDFVSRVQDQASSVALRRSDGQFLDNATADESRARGDICAACPRCVDLSSASACNSCQKILDGLTEAIIGHPPSDSRFFGRACECAGDYLPLALRLSDYKSLPGAPDGCWRK